MGGEWAACSRAGVRSTGEASCGAGCTHRARDCCLPPCEAHALPARLRAACATAESTLWCAGGSARWTGACAALAGALASGATGNIAVCTGAAARIGTASAAWSASWPGEVTGPNAHASAPVRAGVGVPGHATLPGRSCWLVGAILRLSGAGGQGVCNLPELSEASEQSSWQALSSECARCNACTQGAVEETACSVVAPLVHHGACRGLHTRVAVNTGGRVNAQSFESSLTNACTRVRV